MSSDRGRRLPDEQAKSIGEIGGEVDGVHLGTLGACEEIETSPGRIDVWIERAGYLRRYKMQAPHPIDESGSGLDRED